MALDFILFSKNKSSGTIAQDIETAEDLFRNKIKFALDNLPDWLKAYWKTNTENKRELRFLPTGGTMQVDTSFRSATLQFLHISEYGKICNKYPEKAREVQTGALNTLIGSSQCHIESTAEGSTGNFYDMCMQAIALEEQGATLTEQDYKFFFFPWFMDKNYTLDSNFTITQDTEEYFNSILRNEYIQRKFPNLVFTE